MINLHGFYVYILVAGWFWCWSPFRQFLGSWSSKRVLSGWFPTHFVLYGTFKNYLGFIISLRLISTLTFQLVLEIVKLTHKGIYLNISDAVFFILIFISIRQRLVKFSSYDHLVHHLVHFVAIVRYRLYSFCFIWYLFVLQKIDFFLVHRWKFDIIFIWKYLSWAYLFLNLVYAFFLITVQIFERYLYAGFCGWSLFVSSWAIAKSDISETIYYSHLINVIIVFTVFAGLTVHYLSNL